MSWQKLARYFPRVNEIYTMSTINLFRIISIRFLCFIWMLLVMNSHFLSNVKGNCYFSPFWHSTEWYVLDMKKRNIHFWCIKSGSWYQRSKSTGDGGRQARDLQLIWVRLFSSRNEIKYMKTSHFPNFHHNICKVIIVYKIIEHISKHQYLLKKSSQTPQKTFIGKKFVIAA